MQPYRRGYSWEDAFFNGFGQMGGITAVVLICFIYVVGVVMTLVVAGATELARVYQEAANMSPRESRTLQWVLLVFLAAELLGIGLMTGSATFVAGLSICCWAFGIFVFSVEGIHWREQRVQASQADPTLSSVIVDWASDSNDEWSAADRPFRKAS